ncbi:MAG: homoserine O-acetyltransferase [Elusimicrobia bacterium]|nr:homoserine O-acetyltransferase [Candidatus Obscuribacterium magneticum]
MTSVNIGGTAEPGVGVTQTKYYTGCEPPNQLRLEAGDKLGPITVAYETYGQLNKDKSNAILAVHAFTGDAHAAGIDPETKLPGWWEFMIGPGRAFDTNKYFVICQNNLGGCRGTTGPSSINPKTGKRYGLTFPMITLGDIVTVQRLLLDHLGIEKLLCVAGGSMAGMIALQWVASTPERVKSAIPISTVLKHSPQQIAFNEVGRQAIMSDPAWRKGDYYDHGQPERGLALARMIGHITYMSEESMETKFSRKQTKAEFLHKFTPDFEVESYLQYRGSNFVKRFDANSYLYLSKAMDNFDLAGNKLFPAGRPVTTRFLVLASASDWLYPSHQTLDIVKLLKERHADAVYCEIPSTYGHDAFLIKNEEQIRLVRSFLETTYNGR